MMIAFKAYTSIASQFTARISLYVVFSGAYGGLFAEDLMWRAAVMSTFFTKWGEYALPVARTDR